MTSRSRIDEILLNATKKDIDSLLSIIYNEYGDTLYKTTFKILHSPDLATLAVSQTMETIWKRQQEIAEMKHPAAWILQCARHKALNMLRSEMRKHNIEIKGFVLEIEVPESQEKQEWRKMLYDAIQKLPVKQRRVVLLKYLHGLGRREISIALKQSEHTVRNQLATAQKTLKRVLGDDFI